jgi:hypothetical protein
MLDAVHRCSLVVDGYAGKKRERKQKKISPVAFFFSSSRSLSPLNAKRIGESRLCSVSSPFTFCVRATTTTEQAERATERNEQNKQEKEENTFLLDTMQIHVDCNLPPTIVDRTMTTELDQNKGFQRVEQTSQWIRVFA